MTPDDKRRLARIRTNYADVPERGDTAAFLLRLLDEALEGEDSLTRGFEAVERECRGIRQKLRGTEAERDAAMAALREIAGTAHLCAEPSGFVVSGRVMNNVRDVLAAHSAATKPTE